MSWIGKLPGLIGSIAKWVSNPLHQLWSVIFNNLLGNPKNPNTPLGFLFETLTGQLDPTKMVQVHALYAVLAPSSVVLLTFIAGLRVMKLWSNENLTPTMILMDVVPKWGFLVVLLAPPLNIAYNLFGFIADAFSKVGFAIMGNLLAVTAHVMVGGIAKLFMQDVVGVMITTMAGAPAMVPVIVLFALLLAWFLLYLAYLMAWRAITLIFCLVLMPLALPIALYDPQNGFYKWWLGSATGAMAAQIIGCVGFAITLTLALGAPGAGPLQVAITFLMMVVGLALTDKLVKAAESGTVGGAGMGAAGLIDMVALAPRAFRNVFGNVGAGHLSGGLTKLGRGRLAEGDGGGAAGGGGGGSGGGLQGAGGFGAGPRGMLGLFFPQHNVFADAVGVATLTAGGAAKGLLHPRGGLLKPTEPRGQSLWFGAQAGARMALGTATATDASRAIAPTRAGRLTEAKLTAHWKSVDAALTDQAGARLAGAQATHDHLMDRADAMSAGQSDDEVRGYLTQGGLNPHIKAGAPLGQPERDEAAAAIRQKAQASIADAQMATDNQRAAALTEFDSIKQGVVARQAFAVQSRSHPARVGAAAKLTQTQDAHLEAQLRAHAQKFGEPPPEPPAGKPKEGE